MSALAPTRNSITVSARARATCASARVRAAPREACGVLVGTSRACVDDAWELANVSSDAAAFALDPGEIVHAHERARSHGLELAGFWHTHASSSALPSRADVHATWPSAVLLIAGCDGERAWTRDGERWLELALGGGA